MGRQRSLDGVLSGRLVRERYERVGLVALLERAVAEERDARGPCGAVVAFALGLQLRAERDQLAHVGDRSHRAGRREVDEALRVQVVAEEQDRVPVAGREQARAAVVDEVALVDRLDRECEARISERREDRRAVARAAGAERVAPQ
jgi:hypothetical protein